MGPLQFDDNFLNDVGLGGLPDDQKKAFLQHVLETLELRVGTRLSEGLTDEQLEAFEQLSPDPADTPEIAQQKQQAALQWLEANRPDYKQVVQEEMQKLKDEIIASAPSILEANAA